MERFGKAKPTRPIDGSERKGGAARLHTLNLLSPIGWSLGSAGRRSSEPQQPGFEAFDPGAVGAE